MPKTWASDCLLRALSIAMLCVFCAMTAMAADVPRSWSTQISSKDAARLEDTLLTMTNQRRIQQGLVPLVFDEALTQIAREQSAGMARQGFISHEMPAGDLKTRMNIGGYRYKAARENVASSRSLTWAENALMQSPAHRDNILAIDVSRVGIGIVHCAPPYERELFITEVFASPREEHQPAEIQEALQSQIEDLRKNGAGALIADALLERLAQDSALTVDPSASIGEFKGLVANSAEELYRNGISRVDINVQLLRNPKSLKIINGGSILQQAGAFGTAVRRVVDKSNEPAFLVLTLIGFVN